MQTHKHETIIQETDLDFYGHLNNAAYLRLFEQARWALTNSNGYGLQDIVSKQIGPVVLEVSLKFKKEITAREKITIETQMLEITGKIMRAQQVMKKENGDPACEALFVFGLLDMKARRLIEPTQDWLRAIGHGQ